MLKPTELAQHDIDEWEGLSESERAVLVAAIPEAGDHPRLCRAYLRLREAVIAAKKLAEAGMLTGVEEMLDSGLEESDDV